MDCSPSATTPPAELADPSLRDLALRGAVPSPALSEALRARLIEVGLANAEDSAGLSWEVLLRNLDRRDHRSRVAFRVSQGSKVLCHLTLGHGLSDLSRRTYDFAKACPAIACQPLFFATLDGLDCLAVEFFHGESLEAWVADGRMTPAAALAHAGTVFNALEATSEASTSDAVYAELKSFFEQALASPVFGEVDGRFLREFVFPIIAKGALSGPARTCWSNGDFVSRNILVDEGGRVRLVDYEFAARTHFIEEAGWRWRTFSALPQEAQTLPMIPLVVSSASWLEAYFLVRQMVLAQENSVAHRAGLGASQWAKRLSSITAAAWGGYESSCFLRALGALETPQCLELPDQVAALYREVAVRDVRVGTLETELARAQSALSRIESEINAVRAENEVLRCNFLDQLAARDDKIHRMQKSLSWIITAPLRACRRVLLD